jgi:hypothetical protein
MSDSNCFANGLSFTITELNSRAEEMQHEFKIALPNCNIEVAKQDGSIQGRPLALIATVLSADVILRNSAGTCSHYVIHVNSKKRKK